MRVYVDPSKNDVPDVQRGGNQMVTRAESPPEIGESSLLNLQFVESMRRELLNLVIAGGLTPSETDDQQIEKAVANLFSVRSAIIFAGAWDASTGSFPADGYTPNTQVGEVRNGYEYIVTAAGTVDGVTFAENDRLLALTDDPATGMYADNWYRLDNTDKVISLLGRSGVIDEINISEITGVGSAASRNADEFVSADQVAELRSIVEHHHGRPLLLGGEAY